MARHYGDLGRVLLLPLGLALLLFFAVRPVVVRIAAGRVDLIAYLNANAVTVGAEEVSGYRQVYYEYGGSKTYVTEGSRNSYAAVADGEYMAWVTAAHGVGQIVRYHIPSGTTVQLTHSGVNLAPRTSDGKVVWEGWVGDRWQVFLFDGMAVRQLTQGDLSVHPDIQGDAVVYARREDNGDWRAVRYQLSTGASEELARGVDAKFPRFDGGRIGLGQGSDQRYVSGLSEPDGLPPVPSEIPSVGEEDIRRELEALSG